MPAEIIAHPSVPVTTRPSGLYAPNEPTPEQWEVLAAHEGLFALIQKYGAPRVMRWIRSLAVIAGQDIDAERPAHRCLADGAALINHRCVQCGRDNS